MAAEAKALLLEEERRRRRRGVMPAQTLGNIVVSIIGTGVLGLPYAFRTAGWLAGALGVAGAGAATFYCMLLLLDCRDKLQEQDRRSKMNNVAMAATPTGIWGRNASAMSAVTSQRPSSSSARPAAPSRTSSSSARTSAPSCPLSRQPPSSWHSCCQPRSRTPSSAPSPRSRRAASSPTPAPCSPWPPSSRRTSSFSQRASNHSPVGARSRGSGASRSPAALPCSASRASA